MEGIGRKLRGEGGVRTRRGGSMRRRERGGTGGKKGRRGGGGYMYEGRGGREGRVMKRYPA